MLASCVGCHSFAKTCSGMQAKAPLSLDRINSGSMPPGGSLPASDAALFLSWINDGMLCSQAGCP